jgi:hypothetical protein
MPYGGRFNAVERLNATLDENAYRQMVSMECLTSQSLPHHSDDDSASKSASHESFFFLSPEDDDRNLPHTTTHGRGRRLSSMLELDEDFTARAPLSPEQGKSTKQEGLAHALRRAAVSVWKRSSTSALKNLVMPGGSFDDVARHIRDRHRADKKSMSETFSSRSPVRLGQTSSFFGESMNSGYGKSRDFLDARHSSIETMVMALERCVGSPPPPQVLVHIHTPFTRCLLSFVSRCNRVLCELVPVFVSKTCILM